jgi:uncharacterized membrane protein SpoIIM required for sporulation
MTQGHFVQRRERFWNRFEGVINGGKPALKAQAEWFPQGFRELTQDLNIARAHGFDPSLIDRLNRLVLEGNQLLYGQRSWSFKGPADFILRTFPRAVRAQRRGLGMIHLGFYGLAFFIALLCLRDPGFIYDILPEDHIRSLEQMYDPQSSYFLTPRSVGTDADMFGFYIYHNISIAFRIFAGGILAGIGSIFILGVNAVYLGGSAAHMINRGFGETFFPFVSGHSAFELTGLLLSAQGGLLLGYRVFVTQGLSREASLRAAGKAAAPLIAGSALLLVLAAAVEAFWSSRHEIAPEIRYGTGIAGWALLAGYFVLSAGVPAGAFRGRKRG